MTHHRNQLTASDMINGSYTLRLTLFRYTFAQRTVNRVTMLRAFAAQPQPRLIRLSLARMKNEDRLNRQRPNTATVLPSKPDWATTGRTPQKFCGCYPQPKHILMIYCSNWMGFDPAIVFPSDD